MSNDEMNSMAGMRQAHYDRALDAYAKERNSTVAEVERIFRAGWVASFIAGKQTVRPAAQMASRTGEIVTT